MIELNPALRRAGGFVSVRGHRAEGRGICRGAPGERILRLGIGDVSLPLPEAVISALHEAVDEQANPETFQGYLPECGAPFLRKAIVDHYATRGVSLDAGEVFVSSGASDELGDILDLFDSSSPALVIEPGVSRLRRCQRHRGQAHRAAGVGQRRRLRTLARSRSRGGSDLPVLAEQPHRCSFHARQAEGVGRFRQRARCRHLVRRRLRGVHLGRERRPQHLRGGRRAHLRDRDLLAFQDGGLHGHALGLHRHPLRP